MEEYRYYHEAKQIILKKLLASGKFDVVSSQQATEVHTDLILKDIYEIAICGKLYDACHRPIIGEKVKIIKLTYCKGREVLEVVACTETDSKGKYRVVVSGTQVDRFSALIEGDMSRYQEMPTYTPIRTDRERGQIPVGCMPMEHAHRVPCTPSYLVGKPMSSKVHF